MLFQCCLVFYYIYLFHSLSQTIFKPFPLPWRKKTGIHPTAYLLLALRCLIGISNSAQLDFSTKCHSCELFPKLVRRSTFYSVAQIARQSYLAPRHTNAHTPNTPFCQLHCYYLSSSHKPPCLSTHTKPPTAFSASTLTWTIYSVPQKATITFSK